MPFGDRPHGRRRGGRAEHVGKLELLRSLVGDGERRLADGGGKDPLEVEGPRGAVRGDPHQTVARRQPDADEVVRHEIGERVDDAVEHRLRVGHRGADRLQDPRGCDLIFQRLLNVAKSWPASR